MEEGEPMPDEPLERVSTEVAVLERVTVGGIDAQEVEAELAVVGGIRAGEVALDRAVVGGVAADEVTLDRSAVRGIVARSVALERSAARAVVGGQVSMGPGASAVIVIAGRVEGSPRVVLDRRSGLLAVALLGLAALVGSLVTALRSRDAD